MTVIGETAVVEDGVCLLQGVTLGGTGNQTGNRHPKVGKRCHIGAGSSILGNIPLGEVRKRNREYGYGAVVLHVVEACRRITERAPALGLVFDISPLQFEDFLRSTFRSATHFEPSSEVTFITNKNVQQASTPRNCQRWTPRRSAWLECFSPPPASRTCPIF